MLQSAGKVASVDNDWSMMSLSAKLIEAEVMVALKLGKSLFFSDPVTELNTGVNHKTCGKNEVNNLLILLFGDCG